MYISIIFLFLATITSGLFVHRFNYITPHILKCIVVFGGSFLLSTTLVHILPELFEKALLVKVNHMQVGCYLLIGFLLQLFLDSLGGNIAHGNACKHHEVAINTTTSSAISLLIALCFHAILEGMLLGTLEDSGLLIGILLHKIPASFTLGSLLYQHKYSQGKLMAMMSIFALATPMGWLFSLYSLKITYSYPIEAIAVGNILHISTTILFESNPDHQLKKSKWIITTFAAILAIASAHYSHKLH